MLVTSSQAVHTKTVLQHEPYIQYLVEFQESQPIKALDDLSIEFNTMIPANVVRLGLTTRKTNIGI